MIELERQLEEERKALELEKQLKEAPVIESESSDDGDYMERRKMKFNIRENLENRKEKKSLLDETVDEKLVNMPK